MAITHWHGYMSIYMCCYVVDVFILILLLLMHFSRYSPTTRNVMLLLLTALLLDLCSMPTVDHRSEHKLCERSRKPRIDRSTVPGSMYQQCRLYWVRLGSLGGSKSTVLAEWKLVAGKRQLSWRHSL